MNVKRIWSMNLGFPAMLKRHFFDVTFPSDVGFESRRPCRLPISVSQEEIYLDDICHLSRPTAPSASEMVNTYNWNCNPSKRLIPIVKHDHTSITFSKFS